MSHTDAALLALFIVATVAANAYVAIYWFRPWRGTPATRALMLLSWGDVALLDLSAISLIFGDRWAFALLGIAALALFGGGRCYMLYALLTSPGAPNYPPLSWLRRPRER